MSAHTPGPWEARVTPYGEGWQVRVVSAKHPIGSHADTVLILSSSHGTKEKRREEKEANAALISAAPDLLAALERIEHHGCEGSSATDCADSGAPCWVCQCSAAIAKARGEP